MNSDKAIKAGYAITKCNKCHKDIQLIEEVANENNLVDILNESGINAYMSQTGGMNSAAEISTKDNGFIWITYDTYGEDEWLVGSYDNEGDFVDESYMTKDLEELLNHIESLKENNII